MKKLLALDQASIVTGWAIFDLDTNQLLANGKIALNKADPIELRLHQLREQLANILIMQEIKEVRYEDIQYQNNVANGVLTFKTLGQVQGVVMELCQAAKIPSSSILAASWKSTLSIKGRDRATQKRNAAAYVLEKYGKKVTQDEADAICIGTAYLKTRGHDWS